MKVLIIGLGSIAQKHINALRSLIPNTEFFALRSNENAKSQVGIVNIFSYDVISNYNFDFIIISNPTYRHLETLDQIKHLRIPIFIEKPLFSKIEDHNLVKYISELKTITYVACNLRFLECLKKIKEVIKTERINEINIYCGSYLPDWRPGNNYKLDYSANSQMGGGVHIDLIHELDYLYWIFGSPLSSRSYFQSRSSLEIDSYDYANYLWRYDTFCANIILNYYRKTPRRNCEILCENGTYSVDLLKNEITFNNEVIFSSNQKIIETYTAQMNFFVSEILNNKIQFNTIQDAYKLLRLCLNS